MEREGNGGNLDTSFQVFIPGVTDILSGGCKTKLKPSPTREKKRGGGGGEERK